MGVRYFAQDDTRFGLKTLIGRLITACGIKSIGQWQWLFKAFWLYGAVKTATGESFFLQFSHVDTVCYQTFLNEFSKAYSDSLNILQVDNGRCHTSQDLVVPENIILLFQPAYCPELTHIVSLHSDFILFPIYLARYAGADSTLQEQPLSFVLWERHSS